MTKYRHLTRYADIIIWIYTNRSYVYIVYMVFRTVSFLMTTEGHSATEKLFRANVSRNTRHIAYEKALCSYGATLTLRSKLTYKMNVWRYSYFL